MLSTLFASIMRSVGLFANEGYTLCWHIDLIYLLNFTLIPIRFLTEFLWSADNIPLFLLHNLDYVKYYD